MEDTGDNVLRWLYILCESLSSHVDFKQSADVTLIRAACWLCCRNRAGRDEAAGLPRRCQFPGRSDLDRRSGPGLYNSALFCIILAQSASSPRPDANRDSRKTVWIVVVLCCGLAVAAVAIRKRYSFYAVGLRFASGWLHLLPVCPADEAAEEMRLPDGFHVNVVAAEPDVSQPVGMAIDESGRLWVAECRSYPKLNQRHGDQVLIFADNDGDGRLETRTVFVDGLSNLSGIEVGLGGVWLICTPNLLFIPDADSDGKPDGPATVVLDGWDAKPGLSHHVANHLLFGPDGWLYGCLGFSSNSLVGVPGSPAEQRVALNAAIWRMHPQSKKFEIVASGTCNPWGIDFDASGELFASNNVLAHLWHILPGGRYERWTAAEKGQDNWELMTACTDHNHWLGVDDWNVDSDKTRAAGGGHAHAGLMIYQGDNFPAEYRGAVCMCNVHGNCVNFDLLDHSAAEVVARHGGNLLQASDLGFRAVDLKYGPDGSVYVCDWNARGMCHGSDYNAAQPTGARLSHCLWLATTRSGRPGKTK